jgi:hypothetical protein
MSNDARPRAGWVVVSVFVAAVLITGCGSSGQKTSTTISTPSSSTAVAASPPSGMEARLLGKNELAGFQSAGVSTYKTPSSWISREQGVPARQLAAERAMLNRNGFRVGMQEDLMNSGTQGVSLVEQFRSPAAARDALAFYVAEFKAPAAASFAGAYAPLKVSGIPGAVGYSLGGAAGGINIAFSDGAYYYLVGRDGDNPKAIASLIAAAQHLYHQLPQ